MKTLMKNFCFKKWKTLRWKQKKNTNPTILWWSRKKWLMKCCHFIRTKKHYMNEKKWDREWKWALLQQAAITIERAHSLNCSLAIWESIYNSERNVVWEVFIDSSIEEASKEFSIHFFFLVVGVELFFRWHRHLLLSFSSILNSKTFIL